MRRTLLLVLCLIATPALADPLPGTYRAAGRHSKLGAYTGDVTLEHAPDGGWRLAGAYTFADGRRLTWKGVGTPVADRLDVTLVHASPGLADLLAGAFKKRLGRGSYALGTDGAPTTGGWRSTAWP